MFLIFLFTSVYCICVVYFIGTVRVQITIPSIRQKQKTALKKKKKKKERKARIRSKLRFQRVDRNIKKSKDVLVSLTSKSQDSSTY